MTAREQNRIIDYLCRKWHCILLTLSPAPALPHEAFELKITRESRAFRQRCLETCRDLISSVRSIYANMLCPTKHKTVNFSWASFDRVHAGMQFGVEEDHVCKVCKDNSIVRLEMVSKVQHIIPFQKGMSQSWGLCQQHPRKECCVRI